MVVLAAPEIARRTLPVSAVSEPPLITAEAADIALGLAIAATIGAGAAPFVYARPSPAAIITGATPVPIEHERAVALAPVLTSIVASVRSLVIFTKIAMSCHVGLPC
jgi:hypothetical protein